MEKKYVFPEGPYGKFPKGTCGEVPEEVMTHTTPPHPHPYPGYPMPGHMMPGYPAPGFTGGYPGCCGTGGCNVVNSYQVQEVPHVVHSHTHYVNNIIKKHVCIPKHTCSYETKCIDKCC